MNATTADKKLAPVSHPIAFDSDGRLVDVVDAQRGVEYVCVHCARRVVPSHGGKLQWHYRHLDVRSCVPRSDLLLETAHKAIRAAFQNALSTRQSYPLSISCRYCPARLERDLVELFDGAEIVPATSPGQRDRLTFAPVKPGSSPLEVVVLVGSDTTPGLVADAPPTVAVGLGWDDVTSLSKGLVATQYIAPVPLLCRLCSQITSPKRRADTPLAPITEDRYGAPLYPDIATLVNDASQELAGLGFWQAAGKPYLLYRRFGGYVSGVVFADFGGHRTKRIWSTRCGRLYGQFSEAEPGAGDALLSRVAAICEVRDIPLSLDPQGPEE